MRQGPDRDVRIPWHRRLTTRLAAVVVGTLVLTGVATIPVYLQLGHLMYPGWFDASFLRERADALEAVERGELDESALYFEFEEDSDPFDLVWLLSQSVVLALAIYLGVSWLVTRRIRRLAEQARAPLGPESALPGPFEVRGRDEIASLAGTMNDLRSRVEALLSTLARQSEERREWVAQVSHDIRTPITALVACLDRCEQADDPAAARELLAVARADADRVRALAEDLLEVARLDAGAELLCEPVLPAELVHQVVAGLRPWIEERGLRLELALARGLPALDADGHLLSRALENLLRNAAEHAREAIRIELSAASGGDTVTLLVEDDGPGFPDLTEAQSLADCRAQQSAAEGAGLGLAIVERVAELHGGRAEVSPGSNGGARVALRLPAAPAQNP